MSSKKVLINPKGTEQIYDRMQFSQAVKSGNMLFVSGQVGIDENFKIADGIENQTEHAFRNLEKVLAEAGAGFQDIVELVTFHTSMKDMKGFAKIKAKFIPDKFPAWTAIGINELVLPGLLVEIKAIAVIDN